MSNARILALTPNEKRLVLITSTGNIILYDAAFSSEIPLNTFATRVTEAIFATFKNDSNILVTSHSGAIGIRIWSIKNDAIELLHSSTTIGDIPKAPFLPTNDQKILVLQS